MGALVLNIVIGFLTIAILVGTIFMIGVIIYCAFEVLREQKEDKELELPRAKEILRSNDQKFTDFILDHKYDPEPIEVTFDNKTYLRYDREKEVWYLDKEDLIVEEPKTKEESETIVARYYQEDYDPELYELVYEDIPIIGQREPIRKLVEIRRKDTV